MPAHSATDNIRAQNLFIIFIIRFLLVERSTDCGQRSRGRGGSCRLAQQGGKLFHNPAENLWYEDWVSLDGTTLEKLVVDSGQTTELSHYLRLAGIQAEVTKVLDADPAYFEIQKTDAGAYTIEAVKGYKGEKTLTVQTDDGKQYTLTLTGKEECYYIAFGLYLEDGDELLFQSGLVAPGLYVQKMEMTRALAPGEYPAYVVCQPYLSDRTTKTNSGIVKLTLTVG